MQETTFAPPAKIKTKKPRFVPLDAYYWAEEKALIKHEYHNGVVVAMAGGTFNQDNLAGKAITLFNNFIEAHNLNYFVNGSDTKIRIEAYNKVGRQRSAPIF